MTSPHNGAHGAVHLLTDSDALTASVRRTVRLEAAPDGKSLFLIDVDQRKPGTQREVRYEITPAELMPRSVRTAPSCPARAMARPASESDQMFLKCGCRYC
jgi:hypothetical protein